MVVLPPLPTNYKFAGFLRKEKATYASALPTGCTPLAPVWGPDGFLSGPCYEVGDKYHEPGDKVLPMSEKNSNFA